MPFPTLGSLGISLLPSLVPERWLSAEKAGNQDQQSTAGLLSIVKGLCAWQLLGILERVFVKGDHWAGGLIPGAPLGTWMSSLPQLLPSEIRRGGHGGEDAQDTPRGFSHRIPSKTVCRWEPRVQAGPAGCPAAE